MKIEFANGETRTCSAPTEQKLYRASGTQAVHLGWALKLELLGDDITSSDLDSLLTVENISDLRFIGEVDGAEATLFNLHGYDKVVSVIVYYSEDTSAIKAEIQLSKGV